MIVIDIQRIHYVDFSATFDLQSSRQIRYRAIIYGFSADRTVSIFLQFAISTRALAQPEVVEIAPLESDLCKSQIDGQMFFGTLPSFR